MDKNNKIVRIVEGAVLLVLGVLIAIFGGQAVLDIYFGIIAIVGGAVLLGLTIYNIVKKLPVLLGNVAMGTILLTVGLALVIKDAPLSFGALINLFVFIILGLGAGLVLYGIYVLTKRAYFLGIGQIVVGVAAITLSILYITVPEFRTAFWIIAGILVAVYGLVELITPLIEKKK